MVPALARFYDVVYADDLPTRFNSSQRCEFEIESKDLPDDLGGWCCHRPVWNETGRCIWHAEVPAKPSEDLHAAQEHERSWPQEFSDASLTRRLDQTFLRSYEVREQEDEIVSPALSFRDCSMANSNFAHSDFSRASFGNTDLRGSKFKQATCQYTLFQRCNLSNTEFMYANLEGARILRQSIQDADWTGVSLQDANLHDSDLTNTNLRLAELQDTYMTQATLRKCNLEEAELENTDLRDVDLRDAKLYETLVRNIRINEGTLFGKTCVYEDDADLTAAKSKTDETSIFGESKSMVVRFLNRWRNSPDDADQLGKAVRVYRLYQRLLREAALPEDIRSYKIREKHARRKLALRENRYLQWLKLSFDRWLMLYGESPARVVGASIGVIFLFAALYPIAGGLEPESASLVDYVYFSASTFTSLVYGGLQPGNRLVRMLASIQSFAGALLLALLVFVLGRRATW